MKTIYYCQRVLQLSEMPGFVCPVPRPELICQLEHGGELWMVQKDLSQSTCPGRSPGVGGGKALQAAALEEALALVPRGRDRVKGTL